MKFRILPLLLAVSVVSIKVNAQSSIALTSMSSTVNNSTTRTLIDSVVYSYTPGRGGITVVENPIYTSQYAQFSSVSNNNYINKDYSVNMGTMSFDSAKNLKTSALPGVLFFQKELNTYNSSGFLVKQEQFVDPTSHKALHFTSGTTKIVTNYRYYSSGNLKGKDVTHYDASGTIVFSGKDSFAYNTSGMPSYSDIHSIPGYSQTLNYYYSGTKLDSISYGTYYHKFTYNGAGSILSAKLGTTSMYAVHNYYTYNSLGQLLVDSSMKTSISGVTRQDVKIAYKYSVQGDPIERAYYTWNVGTASWDPVFSQTYATYDANHNLLSHYHEVTSGGVTHKDMKYQFAYNSLNQLETFSLQTWDATSSSWVSNTTDTQRHYYYGVVTGVDKVPAPQLQCSIYPVPANAMLNIDISNGKENETAFEVYSTDGRLVRRMAVKTAANGKYTIPVADLSAGTYILHSKNGEMENVKQFTVLH